MSQMGSTRSSSGGFVDTYGLSIAVIFGALVVFHLPLIGLINLIPMFKEVVLGAAVVVLFTSISDSTEGIKYALISGMIAAIAFNALYIPASFVLGGLFGAVGSGGESAAASGVFSGMISGFGALFNLIGVVIFSPIGYATGGLIGSVVND